MPTVTLKFKNSKLRDYQLGPGKSLTVGRRNDNDVVIENLAVSGHHAKIDSVGDGFVLIDLQSKNGSFVNDQLVSSHWLKDGDVINIGKHHLLFSYQDGESQAESQVPEMERTMVMDTSQYRTLVKKSPPTPPPPPARPKTNAVGVLIYMAGGEGHVVLKNGLTKIGRDVSSDLPVKGLFMGKTVATITRRDGGYYFSYAGGLHKPKVNTKTVKDTVLLQDQDIIEVGACKWQFTLKEVRRPSRKAS
jgi:predicted component of type VI protein secretion system